MTSRELLHGILFQIERQIFTLIAGTAPNQKTTQLMARATSA
jgi:hypothetical protein